jgi:hypothetical protein
MLEGFGMVDVLEAPVVPKDVAPRNDMNIDGYRDCFSPVEYSPNHRLKNPHNTGLEEYWLGFKTRQAEEPPYSLMLDKCCWQKYLEDGFEQRWCFRCIAF